MPAKRSIASRLPLRRGLAEAEAAAYLSLSPSFFRTLVKAGRMPRPRLAGRRRIWDVDELDQAFRELPREGGEDAPIFVTEDDNSWADFE